MNFAMCKTPRTDHYLLDQLKRPRRKTAPAAYFSHITQKDILPRQQCAHKYPMNQTKHFLLWIGRISRCRSLTLLLEVTNKAIEHTPKPSDIPAGVIKPYAIDIPSEAEDRSPEDDSAGEDEPEHDDATGIVQDLEGDKDDDCQ